MLSEILTKRRNDLNMSVDELAQKSGVSKSTLAKILTGVSPNPSIGAVKSIAYALGMSLNDIDRHVAQDALSPDEMDILQQYRMLDSTNRELVRRILADIVDVSGATHSTTTADDFLPSASSDVHNDSADIDPISTDGL